MKKLSINQIKASKFTLYFCTSFLGFFFIFIFWIHGWPQETTIDSFGSLQPTISTFNIMSKATNMDNSYAPSQAPSPQTFMSKSLVEVLNITMEETTLHSTKAPSPSPVMSKLLVDVDMVNKLVQATIIGFPTPKTMMGSPTPSPSMSRSHEEVVNFPMQNTIMDSFKAATPSPSKSKSLVEVLNFPMQETIKVSPIAPTPSPIKSQSHGNNNYKSFGLDGGEESSSKECNIFEGNWVYDPQAYPLYHARKCPFLSQQVTGIKNGRPDSLYEHWRWQPSGCDIPRFNGTHMLEMLRGKTVALVGDSINRNMWESLVCLLYSSIPRRSRAIVDVRHARQNWFYNQTQPIVNETYIKIYPQSMVELVKKTMGVMKTLVNYLDITGLSEYRKDAHTSVYIIIRTNLVTPEERKQLKKYSDCSHWCLPGVPDTWNALLYDLLFKKHNDVMKSVD